MPSDITPERFGSYLDTADLPDPDLLIRTSGELRLSNFLLWQLAYSEFVFVDTYWPDFSRETLEAAIAEYQRRTPPLRRPQGEIHRVTPLDVTPSGAEPRAQPNKSEMTTRLASAVVMAVLALGSVVVSIWTFVALVIAAGVHRRLGMGTAGAARPASTASP